MSKFYVKISSKKKKKIQKELILSKKNNYYKKKKIQTKECNICFDYVEFINDNIVTCGKSTHVICKNCKKELNKNLSICPMCRSHGINNNISNEIKLKIFNKINEKNQKNINPKLKKNYFKSKKLKNFPGKNNNYKKYKKNYFWFSNGICYYEGKINCNGEYVSKFIISPLEKNFCILNNQIVLNESGEITDYILDSDSDYSYDFEQELNNLSFYIENNEIQDNLSEYSFNSDSTLSLIDF